MKLASAIALTPLARRWRFLYLLLLPLALLALAHGQPGSLPAWFPFATSCGAITGLPCIFCGITRATHHLLQGDFALALYYNWLSYPLLAGAVALGLIHALELISARNLFDLVPRPRLTRRTAGALAAGFLLLWGLQVYLALSQQKSELLNPRGPLYSLGAH